VPLQVEVLVSIFRHAGAASPAAGPGQRCERLAAFSICAFLSFYGSQQRALETRGMRVRLRVFGEIRTVSSAPRWCIHATASCAADEPLRRSH
jgi:hypothetical protein